MKALNMSPVIKFGYSYYDSTDDQKYHSSKDDRGVTSLITDLLLLLHLQLSEIIEDELHISNNKEYFNYKSSY